MLQRNRIKYVTIKVSEVLNIIIINGSQLAKMKKYIPYMPLP